MLLIEIAKAIPNVSAVTPTGRLCGNDTCKTSMDGEFLWRDVNHIRRNLNPQTRRDFADRIGLTAAMADDRHGHPGSAWSGQCPEPLTRLGMRGRDET